MTIERKFEAEVDGGCSPVALRQHGVLLDLASVGARHIVEVKINEVVLILLDGVRVILMKSVLTSENCQNVMSRCNELSKF